MSENTIVFDSVVFDKEEKTFTILDGSVGVYSYKDIKKCMILGDDARYKGKSSPFAHAIVPKGYSLTPRYIVQNMYLGLKITMKDNQILAIYVSKEAVSENSANYRKDEKEAIAIKKVFDACIRKYTNKKS